MQNNNCAPINKSDIGLLTRFFTTQFFFRTKNFCVRGGYPILTPIRHCSAGGSSLPCFAVHSYSFWLYVCMNILGTLFINIKYNCIMTKLTKAQKSAKISEAKELVISMTKSSGLVMLPANETFEVSIESGVTIDSIESSAITTESGVHKFIPVVCVDSNDKEYKSSLYCGTTEKTPEERKDWHIALFEQFGDVISELSFVGKTGDVRKNKAGYDVTYLSIEE